MKKATTLAAGLLVTGLAHADSVAGVDRVICAASSVKICFETGECFDTMPEQIDVPQFVVLDLKKNTISTTRASNLNRSSTFSRNERGGGLIRVQGMEGERAFSLVIDEATGKLTAAVSGDGFTVSAYGACTDANVK